MKLKRLLRRYARLVGGDMMGRKTTFLSVGVVASVILPVFFPAILPATGLIIAICAAVFLVSLLTVIGALFGVFVL